jgi:hypothetical protein
MKKLMMTSAAALLVAGTAFAADTSWDTNGDGMIDRDEYNAGMSQNDSTFGAWDSDGDGTLSRGEYETGVQESDDPDGFGSWDERYSGWDADEDDMLSSDEYSEGLWGTFDADGDDMWNDEEAAAWEENEMRYDATRSGAEVSK